MNVKSTNIYAERPLPVPSPHKSSRNVNGAYVPDPKPHPDLLLDAQPLSLADQVRELERMSVLRRTSILDTLDADDFGDEYLDGYDDPFTEHELAGLKSRAEQRDDADVSGREEPVPPEKPLDEVVK